MTDLDVVLLARMHSISYRHLARIFMEITGYTLTEWIVYTRLFYGMQFLVETDLSVADIAKQVGFRSDNYFSKVFTHMIGMTPTAFRRERAGLSFVPPPVSELPGVKVSPRHNELYNPLRPHNMDSSRIQFMATRGTWK
jgi:AraC-like DNA-binding protein